MGIRSMGQRVLFLVALFLFIGIRGIPSLCAQDYYADLTIMVDSSGFVNIDGPTNYPNLTIKNTEMYTSKQQNLWLLNITKPGVFSEFIYTVTFPQGSSINSLKSSGFIRVEEHLGTLLVRGFGENETLSIVIQYQIEKKETSFLQENIIFFILLSAIILVSIALLILFLGDKKTKKTEPKSVTPTSPPENWRGLNHRQKQILQVLQEMNIPMTQTDLQKELQIPKASISRNIHGLERKGLIEKETIGMSNLIRLKKP
jgi:uncharacterized membrane protein